MKFNITIDVTLLRIKIVLELKFQFYYENVYNYEFSCTIAIISLTCIYLVLLQVYYYNSCIIETIKFTELNANMNSNWAAHHFLWHQRVVTGISLQSTILSLGYIFTYDGSYFPSDGRKDRRKGRGA